MIISPRLETAQQSRQNTIDVTYLQHGNICNTATTASVTES